MTLPRHRSVHVSHAIYEDCCIDVRLATCASVVRAVLRRVDSTQFRDSWPVTSDGISAEIKSICRSL